MAQVNVKDSLIFAPLISVSYAFQIPGGDLKNSFGVNSAVGGSFFLKDKHNFLYGFSGEFLFGNRIKYDDVLNEVTTSRGYVINNEGLYADVRLFQRGYSFLFHFGKQFSILAPNPNSGFYVSLGGGFLQHKIKVDVVNDDVPQLRDEYLHGYDRLTNGVAIAQTIGYRLLSNSRLTNLYLEFQVLEGFTKNRRSYNIDLMGVDDQQRLDLLMSFRFGWSIPLYKKVPREYYFY